MPSSRMLRGVTLVRTDVSEEYIASIIRVKSISELGTLADSYHQIEAIHSFETSAFTKATRCRILGGDILHSHCRENLKS
jgi:hypothetical protein